MRTNVNNLLRHADVRFLEPLDGEMDENAEQDVAADGMDGLIEESGPSSSLVKTETALESAMDTPAGVSTQTFQKEIETEDHLLVAETAEDRPSEGGERVKEEDDFPDIFDVIGGPDQA